MRFLHTADWHLGMTRRFLTAEAQARYSDARVQAVREVAAIADREGCAFVVACGDLFDSNHVDRQVVARGLDALAAFTMPVLLLPGNHDPLDAASVYRSRMAAQALPPGVTVISDSAPISVAPGVEVVGAPWLTRRPGRDIAADCVSALAPAPHGVVRVLAAHGAVDVLSPDADDPDLVHLEPLRRALLAGAVSYVALGDRHSAGVVGDDPRIRYSGTPVATDYGEVDPGKVLVVDLPAAGAAPVVTAHAVGEWTFTRIEARLDGADDVSALDARLTALPDKPRTVVRLALVGALSMSEDARLRTMLDHHAQVVAALTISEARSDLAVIAHDTDLDALGLAGYAREAAAELIRVSSADGALRQPAQDALRLLHRLARTS
jgi:DNA repair exonuclease SbcCD nuclease subunit